MEGDPDHHRGGGAAVRISIHTLRMEGDRYDDAPSDADVRISIHTLRMEGDPPAPNPCPAA